MKKGFNKIQEESENGKQQSSNIASQQLYNQQTVLNSLMSIPNLSANLSQNLIASLFQVVEQQALQVQSLMQRVQNITLKIGQLALKVKQLKKNQRTQIHFEAQSEEVENIIQPMQNLKPNNQPVDSASLFKVLFGSSKVYQYKLRITQKIDLPIYRERNFSIELEITDMSGKPVSNKNKIPLSLALYSSDHPPKKIETNTTGQKILKGYNDQSLHYGSCRFEKIQIKEVSSHFRNGWIFIVIIPTQSPYGTALTDDFIEYEKIQPLILEKIIIKAKKQKQKQNKQFHQQNEQRNQCKEIKQFFEEQPQEDKRSQEKI